MNNLKLLPNILINNHLDALLVSKAINIAYLTGITHFSVEEREAFVLVTSKQLYLFTDARYTGGIKNDEITVIECTARSSFYDQLTAFLHEHKPQTIGFENTNLTVYELERLKKLDKKVRFVETSELIEQQRITKTAHEIKNLQQACILTDQAFSYILPFIKKGATEKEIAAELEYFIRKNGGEIAFSSIVAFGANAAIPHHHTGNTKLTKLGTPILLDFGARVNGYNADMTRTVFFGKPSGQLEQQYKAVHFTQIKALDTLQKALQKDHHAVARVVADAAEEALHKTGFPALPHGLGHGVGLEVHEAPHLSTRSKDILTSGMTITVEPGIYILGNAGVRIEDTVLITESSIKLLTHAPKSIIIL